MKYVLLLALLIGVSAAAQPGPVYRSATVTAPKPSTPVPVATTPEAEERESPAYPTTAQDPARAANTAAPSGGQPNAPLIRHAGTEQPSAYKYYYVPQPGYDSAYPNPMSATSPTGYQAVAGNGNGGYFSNINWMDYVVGASSLGLVALGSALLYPNLPTWRQRAMRELSNMSSEDAARMAKTVMKAVARFSEMNNARAD